MSQMYRNIRFNLDLEGHEREAQPSSFAQVKTKMVCTIGPKTKSPEMLGKMMEAGMNVARLNFSHGTHEYHGEVIDNVRKALANDPKRQCAILLDTKGPEIRTGKLADKQVELMAGQPILVSVDNTIKGDGKMISLDYPRLCHSVKPGLQILIADGLIALSVEKVDVAAGLCHCRVVNSAVLGETKNVHLPGAIVDLPAVSEQDIRDLKFGVEKDVDMVAASFIRKPEDVLQIRDILGEKGKGIRIISKIESIEGIENFEKILEVSDGIMVARGDLGVELPMEQIFIAQKMMISKCNAVAKPVITATQMLESMIKNPRPTRAEATDVANAVLDGTDCVMLSGETAGGDYPLEAIRIMRKICAEAERVDRAQDYPKIFAALYKTTPGQITDDEHAASYAVRVANDLRADAIVTLTDSGRACHLLSKYRANVPVLAVTYNYKTAMALLLSKAAVPIFTKQIESTDVCVSLAIQRAKDIGVAKVGSHVVLYTGTEGEKTQTVRVITISQ